MKRFAKWCLIVAGVLLALGVGLHAAGAAMGGRAESGAYFAQRWDDVSGRWYRPIGGLLGTPQTKDSGPITDAISAIDVDVDCGDVILQQGDCFSVSMEWNLRGFTLDYAVENGVLKVESDSKSGFLNGVSGWSNQVTITVPEWTVMKKVELSTNLGDVSMAAANFYVYEADLSTDLGDVSWSDTQCLRELDAETSLGDVDVCLPGSQGDYRWQLETSLGELSVNGETQNGDAPGAELHGGTGECRINASSSLGDVNMSFVGRDSNDLQPHGKYGEFHTG